MEKDFFDRDPKIVARDLLGKKLVHEEHDGRVSGIIVETEAYYTKTDKASHTFYRPSALKFFLNNLPGTAYVYFTYGNHWMLNVLTKDGAVLFRALEPVEGIKKMKIRRKTSEIKKLSNGPGKLAQALGINGAHNGLHFAEKKIFVKETNLAPQIVEATRIGITRDSHKKLRFYIKGNEFVSKK
ncbi:MAG TPA: DNA-3-methyladenine glycosylase [Candidatus Nanoarchaeia archaeon]|nr:DNA-3-methyladenine glycosylase [Candidatus Nanoarchaeia archaeon]